jgi:hypothetical protein
MQESGRDQVSNELIDPSFDESSHLQRQSTRFSVWPDAQLYGFL